MRGARAASQAGGEAMKREVRWGTSGSLRCMKSSEDGKSWGMVWGPLRRGLLRLRNLSLNTPGVSQGPLRGSQWPGLFWTLLDALREAPRSLLQRPHTPRTDYPGLCLPCCRLKGSRLKVRFCTNESQKSRAELVGQLRRLGFDISEGEVTAPAPAACQILKERGLRPYLLIHDGRPAGHQDLTGVKAPLSQGGGCAEGLFHWAGPLTELGHHHSWAGCKNLMRLPAGGWGAS